MRIETDLIHTKVQSTNLAMALKVTIKHYLQPLRSEKRYFIILPKHLLALTKPKNSTVGVI